jgi:transcriptional regulator with XRE-family HTH domain
MKNELPDNLRNQRKILKLTRTEMAQKLGIASSTYANYENGHRTPDCDVLIGIAYTLGISLDDLLGIDTKRIKFGQYLSYCKMAGYTVNTIEKNGMTIVNLIKDDWSFNDKEEAFKTDEPINHSLTKKKFIEIMDCAYMTYRKQTKYNLINNITMGIDLDWAIENDKTKYLETDDD